MALPGGCTPVRLLCGVEVEPPRARLRRARGPQSVLPGSRRADSVGGARAQGRAAHRLPTTPVQGSSAALSGTGQCRGSPRKRGRAGRNRTTGPQIRSCGFRGRRRRVNFSEGAAADLVCETLAVAFPGAGCSGLFFGFDGACDCASHEFGRSSWVPVRRLSWSVRLSELTWWETEFVFERVSEREFGCTTGVSGDDGQRSIGVAQFPSREGHSPPGEVGDGWPADEVGESAGETSSRNPGVRSEFGDGPALPGRAVDR